MLKTIRILTVTVLMLASCSQSKDEKARELIEHYCETSLRYPDYRPIVFDKPKPWHGSYRNSTENFNRAVKLKSQRDSIRQLSVRAKNSAYFQLQMDSIDKVLSTFDTTMVQNGKNNKEISGWQVLHIYFYKNGKGSHVKATTLFMINENFTRVLQTQNQ